MKRRCLYTLSILGLALLLVACSSAQAAPSYDTTPTDTFPTLLPPTLPPATQSEAAPPTTAPTATPYQYRPTSTPFPTPTPFSGSVSQDFGPDVFPWGVNPLTGLRPEDPSRLDRRPVAVKVPNFPRSVRPQWGLSAADHVYEYYLEWGLTRFAAIVYGQDAERLGPIRSARLFDEHLIRMYKAYLVFAGADPRVIDPWLESDLKKFLVLERPENCPPLCRIGSDQNYNTLFANTAQLTEYVSEWSTPNGRQNLDGMRFEQGTPYSEHGGKRLGVYYSTTSYNRWDYDPETMRYLRYQDAAQAPSGQQVYEPLMDSLTGMQISTDNVVVLFVRHDYFLQSTDTEIFEMNFMGEGTGFAYREGLAYAVRWRRAAKESLLSLYLPDGRHYPLRPGTTWFQIVGVTSPVVETADGVWYFEFQIP